jgi:hypothetical protein
MQQNGPDAEQETQVARDARACLAKDRRRPGRRDHVNPALIPLLRGEPTPDLPLYDEPGCERIRGDLAGVFGIGVSVVLSGLLWPGIGLAMRVLLH